MQGVATIHLMRRLPIRLPSAPYTSSGRSIILPSASHAFRAPHPPFERLIRLPSAQYAFRALHTPSARFTHLSTAPSAFRACKTLGSYLMFFPLLEGGVLLKGGALLEFLRYIIINIFTEIIIF